MSSGKQLQEMDVASGIKQSKTAVNANAKPADSMPTMADPGTQLGSVEDLGGPTPDNYKPDNDSAKLKEPGSTLKKVKDVVTKGAKPAEPMKGMKEEETVETEDQQEIVAETEETTDEVVAEEETVEETPIPDIEDDVNALLGGEELSEEFKAKAKTIFEAAVTSRVAEARAEIEAAHAEIIEEEVAKAKEELSERVDSYLEYVSEEWMTENQLAVEHGLKTELTESFLAGMKGLFEEHYVTIPDDKYDVLESMVEKLDDMETKLNEQIDKNIGLNKRLGESVADGILTDVSEGLASTQKEKLASLAESVEFDSEETYREKLETLKESYFTSKPTTSSKSETLSEGVDHAGDDVTGSMAAYMNTLSRFK